MIDAWLAAVPPIAVYGLVALLVAMESVGVPIPGETALITAALMSSAPQSSVSVYGVAAAGIAGAVGGDSIGYAVGHRFGPRLFEVLGRRFPRHWSPDHVDYAAHLFEKYGMVAVFSARFVALLRMLAGPMSGSLRMPYRRFLVANAIGGIVWAGGITLLVHALGSAAHQWISRGAWVMLAAALVLGLLGGRATRNAFQRGVRNMPDRDTATEPESARPGSGDPAHETSR